MGGYSRLVREINILILGIDNSGKTALLYYLCHKDNKNTPPQPGINAIQVNYFRNTKKINFYDLGGQKTLRLYWEYYYDKADAIIYMVDGSDEARIEESLEIFKSLLRNEKLNRVPILIYNNKADIHNCLGADEIIEKFEINDICGRDWSLYSCSAYKGTGVKDGIRWLFEILPEEDYHKIEEKYDKETKSLPNKNYKNPNNVSNVNNLNNKYNNININFQSSKFEEKEKERKSEKERIKEIEKERNEELTIRDDKIKQLMKELKEKENEIKELKKQLPFSLEKGEKIISVNFISYDENIFCSIICKNSLNFEDVEKLFYKKYPEYKNIKNEFIIKGQKINKKKNLEENNIYDNSLIYIKSN